MTNGRLPDAPKRLSSKLLGRFTGDKGFEPAQMRAEMDIDLTGALEVASAVRAVVDALSEPTVIITKLVVTCANDPAKAVLGGAIESRDVRLAIRHPAALELILAGESGEVDVTGIGEAERPWRVIVRRLNARTSLIRILDRAPGLAAEKMRIDFVANASHELRTPLTTVIGYAETLADGQDLPTELRQKFANTIRDEGKRMFRIIDDLMSLSRIEADRFVEPSEAVDIPDIIRTAVANVRRFSARERCQFNLHVPDDLPAVKGDRAQLVQVFDNLLSNALRYGCDQPLSSIDISSSVDRDRLQIVVTDHGQGISREHVGRVTQRFYRVSQARSRETGGTGLGLAIVKHIVERHRGELLIESMVGVGTSVSVRLPCFK